MLETGTPCPRRPSGPRVRPALSGPQGGLLGVALDTGRACRRGRLVRTSWSGVSTTGDALFIPAGWVHEVTAVERSLALSLLASGPEYTDFERWTSSEQRLTLLPFLAELRGSIDGARITGAFALFVARLLHALALPELPRQLLAMYSAATRAEMGILPAAPWRMGCPAVTAADDTAAIGRAVEATAARLRTYDASLRSNYVLSYLENVLGVYASFLHGKEPKPGEVYATMLDFTAACLVPKPRVKIA